MKSIFKEEDLVRVIEGEGENIIFNQLYIVDWVDNSNYKMVYLKSGFNDPNISGGWFPHRFKKIIAGDLTSEELSSYIKYKFKIGKVI